MEEAESAKITEWSLLNYMLRSYAPLQWGADNTIKLKIAKAADMQAVQSAIWNTFALGNFFGHEFLRKCSDYSWV